MEGGDNACESDMDVNEGLELPPPNGIACVIGSHAPKDEFRLSCSRENWAYVLTKTTTDIAKTNIEKVKLMADQSVLQLFNMPVESAVEDNAREYLLLHLRE